MSWADIISTQIEIERPYYFEIHRNKELFMEKIASFQKDHDKLQPGLYAQTDKNQITTFSSA